MEISEIILPVGGVLLGFLFASIKSYFEEKGKGYATKKDIGKITKIVEDVKKQYSADTEFLKSRLNLFSQSFHSIKTLERDALIEINKKYSEWLHTMTTFSLAYYSYKNNEFLEDYYLLFSQKLKEFEVAQDNLNLYMHDEELRKNLLDLSQQTRELQKSVITNISAFSANCYTYNEIRKIAPEDQLVILNLDYHKKQEPIIDKSIEELISIHKTIVKHHVSFIKILNNRIYQLIEEK